MLIYYYLKRLGFKEEDKKIENKILKHEKENESINLFINRDNSVKYEKFGRFESKAESKKIDKEIKILLKKHEIKYIEVPQLDLEYSVKFLRDILTINPIP